MGKIACVVVSLCLLVAPLANAQNLIRTPFSVVFDSLANRYLVSSTGNNCVIAIDEQGGQSVFLEITGGLGHLYLEGDDLYVVWPEGGGLSSYDRVTGVLTDNVATPTAYLAGMAADTSGYLYAANQYGSVLRFKRSDLSFSTFASGLDGGPQGVAFDKTNNRIVVCAYSAGSPMWSIDLSDGSRTLFATGVGHQDGITIDQNGNFYTSAFWWQEAYGWDNDGNFLGAIASGIGFGPKGLHYNQRDNVLAVPLYFNDSVAFLSFADGDGDGVLDYRDNCPELYNATQSNADGDAFGDACDLCTDTDGDGYGNSGFAANTCSADNCPAKSNPGQSDWGDHDGVGDDCDNCIFMANRDQIDSDGDGKGDVCDCCVGRTGDANGEGEYPDDVTLADIMLLVDVKFVSDDCSKLTCLHEADVNQDGGLFPTCDFVTLGDIMTLVDFLFISGPENATLPECL